MRKTLIFGTLVLLLLASAPALMAAGGSSAPPPPTSSSTTLSPEELARVSYNDGLKLRDKAWKLEAKAAQAEGTEKQDLLDKAQKQYKKAISRFEGAIKQQPDFHQAHSSLGYALRRTGAYEEALAAYDQALELDPGYAEAIEYRAEAYLGLNRLDEAKAAYMKLFTADRARADQLMEAMETWIDARRADAKGVSGDEIEAFAAWVAERAKLAEQTADLAPGATHPW